MQEGSGRNLLHSFQWKPSLPMLSSTQLESFCKANNVPKAEDKIIDYYQKLTRAILWTIEVTFAQLSEKDRNSSPPHIRNYILWMELTLTAKSGMKEAGWTVAKV